MNSVSLFGLLRPLRDEPDLHAAIAGGFRSQRFRAARRANRDPRYVDAPLLGQIVPDRLGPLLVDPASRLMGIGMTDDHDSSPRIRGQALSHIVETGLVDVTETGEIAREAAR